jgi:hypothetical protein
VLGIGDGVVQGLRTAGQISGFGIRACMAVSTADRPVSWFNEAEATHGSAAYAQAGSWAIATLQPQFALIQTWTANDPPTDEAAERALARAVELAALTRRNGGTPILLTAPPAFAEDTPAEAVRRASAAQVRDLRAGPVLDLEALWGEGEAPVRYRGGFNGGDHRHPSNRACEAAGLTLADMLSDLLTDCR